LAHGETGKQSGILPQSLKANKSGKDVEHGEDDQMLMVLDSQFQGRVTHLKRRLRALTNE